MAFVSCKPHVGERDLVHLEHMKGAAGPLARDPSLVQVHLTWSAGTLELAADAGREPEADAAPYICPAYTGSWLPVKSQESWGKRSKDTSARGRLSGHHPSWM